MGALQRRDNTLNLREKLDRVDRLSVRRRIESHPATIAQVAQFRPDSGIVESGSDGMSLGYLPLIILQHVALAAMQHAHRAALHRRRMLASAKALTRRLDAQHLHISITHERIK